MTEPGGLDTGDEVVVGRWVRSSSEVRWATPSWFLRLSVGEWVCAPSLSGAQNSLKTSLLSKTCWVTSAIRSVWTPVLGK